MDILRTLVLVCIAGWLAISGFFSFAVAPLAFRVIDRAVAGQLVAAREAGIDRLVTEWEPDKVPELRRLLGRITTTLVATDTSPEHDGVSAPAAPAR